MAYILFFEARLEEAVDTINQARDLAAAARSTDLEAECDATLALFHTRSGKMEDTVRLARRALALASETADAVRYRAHLALATVMQVAGLPEAFAEYRAARECARRVKDDFAVAAAFHRMAVAQAIDARQQFEAGRMQTETARQAIVGLQSSMEMTASIAPAATKVVDGLMLAQLYLLTGELNRADILQYPKVKNEPGVPVRVLRSEGPDALYVMQSGLAGDAAAGARPTHRALYQANFDNYVMLDGTDTLKVPLTWTSAAAGSALLARSPVTMTYSG